jgi:transposase InsO family protein
MTVELASLGSKVSRITVAKYMNQLGLRSKLSKIQGYDHSKHNHLIMPNVLNREFSVTEPSKVWVSDITYIRVKEGFLYLTTVLDLYDRKK